jgi:hypothetical protein
MKTKYIKLFGLGLATVVGLSSCSDDFLKEKKNYDNATRDIYNYYEGANGRLNDIYSWCLPNVNDLTWKYPSCGNADLAGKSTEEYSGFSDFVNPEIELSSMSSTNAVPDFIMGTQTNIQEAVYGRIRNINDVLEGIEEGSLSREQKDVLEGQVYFFRAWCYYNLFKWYGGVAIVTNTQDPVEGTTNERRPAKEVKDFIISDLDKAAKMLAGKTMNGGWGGSDYGRVTTGTALALKGRVLQLWCSPLFNRANDESRWKEAHKVMKAELDSINKCGYGLYQTSTNTNASDFANMFAQSTKNPEAVFVTLFNNVTGDGLDNQKNNIWERSIRPKNQGGSGKNASEMLVHLFPMRDGKIPAGTGTYTKLETSDNYAYSTDAPFMNRDPRFYRTFAFPGFRWAYNGDASTIDANNPNSGKDFVLWNYVWYTNQNDQGDVESGNSYGADNLLSSRQGVYVRKKSDDLDCNASPLYQYYTGVQKGAYPFFSAAPLMEIRYAEVLLNLAEVACGAGELSEAVDYLKQIRARVGGDYKAENNYGLQANLVSDQAACMSAILYERQIEFAYEGKRFDDMRRWMLYDGGAVLPDGAPATWKLTGWGGNTCTWLGVKPFNGQRRENMEFRVADQYGVGGTTYNSDPLVKAGVTRPEGVNLMKGSLSAQLTTLAEWYNANLKYKMKKGDSYDSQHNPLYINFRPKYYFLGIPQGVSSADKVMKNSQTIGWQDYNNGGALGTFDPLAE